MTPEMFAELREPLPPGPAFIQEYDNDIFTVPEGYTFQPATEHSPAGWVRPSGDDRPKPGEVNYEQRLMAYARSERFPGGW